MNLPALGDLAHYAFRPAVLVIDVVWGTDLRDCDVCKARRARWNALPYSRLLAAAILTMLAAGAVWGITR